MQYIYRLVVLFIFLFSFYTYSQEDSGFQMLLNDFNNENYENVINNATKMINLAKSTELKSNLYILLIDSYINTGNYEQALKLSSEYKINFETKNKLLSMFLDIKTLFYSKKYDECVVSGNEFFRQYKQGGTFFKNDVYFYVAESLFKKGNYIQALAVYNTLLDYYPGSKYKIIAEIRKNFIENLDEKDKLLKVINKIRQENIELIKKLN